MPQSDNNNSFSFSANIYSNKAIILTANEYRTHFQFELEYKDEMFIVHYKSTDGFTLSKSEFENRLIENSIRYDILEKTSDVRKLVLARAFASTIIDTKTLRQEDEKETQWEENIILQDWFHKDHGDIQ